MGINYNQSLEAAKVSLQDQLQKMRAEKDRTQLKVRGISADDAYELGYETALYDLDVFTGDDPREVELVNIRVVNP